MSGSRVAVRLAGEWQHRNHQKANEVQKPIEHVLVIGMGDLTELYLRSVAELAPANLVIVGILSPGVELRGRFIRSYKILGEPEDVRPILAQLGVHGVIVDRIVVTQPLERLSRETHDELRDLERSSITIDWLVESLGLRGRSASNLGEAPAIAAQPPNTMEKKEGLPLRRYHQLKRTIDAITAIFVIFVLAPVFLIVALLVAIDVGLPLVFWQKRPGRYGRSFKLFKFRTMGGAHDAAGNRIPDDLRSSSVGRFLRRSWLDELPQLYNILIGEMSFVGPRPLLPVDQPNGQSSRLLVRPGLTGWAQVNGGRDISPEEKGELDLWYVENASFRLDIKILWQTLAMMIFGERLNIKVQQPSMRTKVGSKQAEVERYVATTWYAQGVMKTRLVQPPIDGEEETGHSSAEVLGPKDHRMGARRSTANLALGASHPVCGSLVLSPCISDIAMFARAIYSTAPIKSRLALIRLISSCGEVSRRLRGAGSDR